MSKIHVHKSDTHTYTSYCKICLHSGHSLVSIEISHVLCLSFCVVWTGYLTGTTVPSLGFLLDYMMKLSSVTYQNVRKRTMNLILVPLVL